MQLSYGQTLNTSWKADLAKQIEEFKNCSGASNQCYKHIGQALKSVYSIDDFYSKKDGRYLTSTEIVGFLENNSKWEKIGNAIDQANLDVAQKNANEKVAVVAVYMGENNLGNVSLILPGNTSPSGSWGFSVPNSACMFMNNPGRSYMDKGLSYAFTRSMIRKVNFYKRVY